MLNTFMRKGMDPDPDPQHWYFYFDRPSLQLLFKLYTRLKSTLLWLIDEPVFRVKQAFLSSCLQSRNLHKIVFYEDTVPNSFPGFVQLCNILFKSFVHKYNSHSA